MTGKIMKGIGGFYYVYVEGSGLYECRARGIFRNKKMKPNVGDVVDIDILSEEEKNLLIHMIQVVHEDTRKRPMFREALILSIAYAAYNKIGMLDYHLQENQNEYGAIYDTSLKNYLYIAKELNEEYIQDGNV